jgi:hypothetical protein
MLHIISKQNLTGILTSIKNSARISHTEKNSKKIKQNFHTLFYREILYYPQPLEINSHPEKQDANEKVQTDVNCA